MRIRSVHPRELDDALVARWHALRHDAATAGHPLSPFFTPEFARLVATVRPSARVAIVEVDGAIAGFFAFERLAPGLGVPLATRMSDYHGPLLDARAPIDAAALVRGCGLAVWRFHHLVGGTGFGPHETGRRTAWLARLDDGFDAYRARADARSGWWRRSEKALRRLERRHGPLRFVAHTTDAGVFERLAQWKSQQYVRTGQVDNFRIRWVRDYLEALRRAEGPRLAGTLSALHAGDRLVAAHLGLRSETVWHHYLPTYDRELAPYSPGGCLLHRLMEAAPALGLTTIDFGEGDMDYKLAVCDDRIEVAHGAVEPRALRALRLGGRALVERLRRSETVLGLARRAKRGFRDLSNGLR
ncbi:MAG TPA: GNAT family N-acetyltransferase [Burkholderiaceae bacterium]|nr:GNAT family N-acetyltransferase [Burkholderiaceae bacterium]